MSSSSTTKLPPSNIGTGALYTPTIPTTSLRAAPIAHFASTPNDGIGNDGLKSTTLNFKGGEFFFGFGGIYRGRDGWRAVIYEIWSCCDLCHIS